MPVINPYTNQPSKPELSDEQILRALSILQMKIDGIAQQMFNTSIVIEYMMELMSNYEVNGSLPLEIVPERLAAFAQARSEQLQEEMREQMKQQVGATTEELKINLDE